MSETERVCVHMRVFDIRITLRPFALLTFRDPKIDFKVKLSKYWPSSVFYGSDTQCGVHT